MNRDHMGTMTERGETAASARRYRPTGVPILQYRVSSAESSRITGGRFHEGQSAARI